MINSCFYITPFICRIAESNPPIIIGRLDLLITPFIEVFIAIINHRIYNMDNYFSKICVTPRKHFICLICSALYTRIIPFFSNALLYPYTEKVFNQKNARIINYKNYIKKQNERNENETTKM